MDQDWSEFKADVSMKTLINDLDKAIKRRMRLYLSDDTEETERMASFKKKYLKYKPIKYLALTVYLIIPFFEKPGWCIQNSELDTNTTEGYWYCNTADGDIANSHIPKLPTLVSDVLLLISLIILGWFTKARDQYRKRDKKGDTVALQLWLIALGIFNLIITIIVVSIDISDNVRKNNLIV